MRWEIAQEPNNGETRTLARFAWMPTKVKGYILWLEFYCEDQTYNAYFRQWLTDRRWKGARS